MFKVIATAARQNQTVRRGRTFQKGPEFRGDRVRFFMAYILYIIMNFKDLGKLAEQFLKRCTGLNGEPVGYAGSTKADSGGIWPDWKPANGPRACFTLNGSRTGNNDTLLFQEIIQTPESIGLYIIDTSFKTRHALQVIFGKPSVRMVYRPACLPPKRIELLTQGFSVLRSTN